MNFWVVAAVLVSGEGTTPPHVGLLSQSHQSLAVAFGSSFQEAPPLLCMLGGSSFSALAVIGTACFFAGQLSSPAPAQSRPLEVRCSCSDSTEVSSQLTLEQGETRGWRYAALGTLLFALAGGLLCGGFAAGAVSVVWWQRVTTRSEQTFLREAIPLRTNRSVVRN